MGVARAFIVLWKIIKLVGKSYCRQILSTLCILCIVFHTSCVIIIYVTLTANCNESKQK